MLLKKSACERATDLIQLSGGIWRRANDRGIQAVTQEPLVYAFGLERHVPANHLLRSVYGFVDLSGIREHQLPYYSDMGRLSIDPEELIRMLIVGYCMGIRSARRLCDEVLLNPAYRWFCRHHEGQFSVELNKLGSESKNFIFLMSRPFC